MSGGGKSEVKDLCIYFTIAYNSNTVYVQIFEDVNFAVFAINLSSQNLNPRNFIKQL